MKNLLNICCTVAISAICLGTTSAQTKTDKKAVKIAEIAHLVNTQNYLFVANFVNPSRGGGHALTSDYDMVVAKDSVICYLPYFGRAHLAEYGSTDNGIKSTLTKFSYKLESKKKGWDITIVPNNVGIGDPKAIQTMRLSISSDGYASLQVISVNRDPISFDGFITERPKPKH